MNVSDLTGKVGVVTGAASGIGRATALALAARGADVALCDVSEPGLAAVAKEIETSGRRTSVRVVDVSARSEMSAFAEQVWGELGRIDLVVNNAGIGVGGPFTDVPLAEWDAIVGINLMGVVHGCAFFVPKMIAAGNGGHVVNISSMAGYMPAPGMTAYGATKFAVLGFSESLAIELAPHHIGVTAICPGIIDTPITRSSRMYGPEGTEDARAESIRVFERRAYPPERVAKNILKAVQRNKIVAPVSPEAHIAYALKRLSPGGFTRLIRWGASRRNKK